MTGWPRHVLMTADTVGGVFTFAVELTRALSDLGVRVTLAATGRALSRDQRQQLRAAGDPCVHESSCLLEWQDNPWDEVDRMGDWLLRIAENEEPDLVHLNDYSNASRDWNLPVVVTGHSCVLSWFRAVHNCEAPIQWDEYRCRVRRGLRSANVVTAPSHAMLHSLDVHYGPLSRTAVIPNGRNPAQFYPAPKERFILSAGRIWDEAKNIDTLAKVAGRLSWPVYLAGEQQHASFLNVTSLGPLSSICLASWMSRASIYCLPAKYEPFGLSILEAALSRCALILGDIDSLRENWRDCACFVDPSDPHALYGTTAELIRNPALREHLAANANERARAFSPLSMAQTYLHAYKLARHAHEEETFAGSMSA